METQIGANYNPLALFMYVCVSTLNSNLCNRFVLKEQQEEEEIWKHSRNTPTEKKRGSSKKFKEIKLYILCLSVWIMSFGNVERG